MEPRRLIKLMARASVMAACSPAGNMGASRVALRSKPLVPGPKTKVFLAGVSKNASEDAIKQAVRCSAEAATDFSWLSKGDIVFIKPAINSGNPYPSTTSPIAIAAMVELLREKGAGRVIVGEMSGVEYLKFSPTRLKGSTRELMEASGIAKVVQASGAELHFFEEAGWSAFHEEIPLAGSHWKHALMMPDILKEVQHIVLMPRCGRHLLAGSTLGLKAAVGYWRHDTRLEYHHDASTFNEKTAEANTVETLRKKQRLVVTAADKILTTIGPDKGYVFQPDNGLVIASESVVAHDMISLAWLMKNRCTIPDTERNGFIDTSKLIPRLANHVLVGWLGGWGQALTSESFNKNTLNAVWDDLVLNHAYEVYGGVPEIILESSNNMVPVDLKKRLNEMTEFPC
ncbi:MAG: DUF362 domain-containing protein [Syntrophobacteraceae bacterium]|jgi:uncharacterized protein (DUF362 family)